MSEEQAETPETPEAAEPAEVAPEEFWFASFDDNGRCTYVMHSAVDLGMPFRVPQGTSVDDIYYDLQGHFIGERIPAEITTDREYILCDGEDRPAISGCPGEAFLVVNGIVEGDLTMQEPGVLIIQTTAKYKSNTLYVQAHTLEFFKDKFSKEVDDAAAKARLVFVTDVSGQSAVYAEKEKEAREYLGMDPAERLTVDPSLFPFMQVETGPDQDMLSLAEKIVERADKCRTALAQIEGLRMSAKATIATSQDVAAMVSATQIAWPQKESE